MINKKGNTCFYPQGGGNLQAMNSGVPISFHGGHSGQFCYHADDTLDEIIQQYIRLGFKTVGVSEHIPPVSDLFLMPDEKEAGLTAADIYQQFEVYIKTINQLKTSYAGKITIFIGMETETYEGAFPHIHQLVNTFKPDYLVGSVHHIGDVCFDYSKENYHQIISDHGSHEAVYQNYFDQQYEMIKEIKPFVVGHFDLIRIFDPDYEQRLKMPGIKTKITRNLELIKSLNLVMDFNVRSLLKGAKEPYVSRPILELARKMGIRVIPGDDSHGVHQAGLNIDKAITILEALGFETRQWPDPILLT